ncbi:MAG: hypothetical protein AAGI72_02940 [Pseudomonadota bacterium]
MARLSLAGRQAQPDPLWWGKQDRLLRHPRKDLIATHYSSRELREVLAAAAEITAWGVAQTPALTIIRRYTQDS